MDSLFSLRRASMAVGTVSGALAVAATALAQQAPSAPRDYYVGNPGVGLPVAPPAPGQPAAPFAAASGNVRMFGSLYQVESCSYDPERGVIVAPSRGVPQAVRANDAWISFINHDGSVHTPRWIGIQNSGAERDTMTPPLVLNEPLGSLIHNNVLYLAERDGGTPEATRPGQNLPSIAVVRSFDMNTGRPLKSVIVPGSTGLNDIAMAADGTPWFFETAPDPNVLQAFDPKRERFVASTTVKKAGVGEIRHMEYRKDCNCAWFGSDRNTLGRATLSAQSTD